MRANRPAARCNRLRPRHLQQSFRPSGHAEAAVPRAAKWQPGISRRNDHVVYNNATCAQPLSNPAGPDGWDRKRMRRGHGRCRSPARSPLPGRAHGSQRGDRSEYRSQRRRPVRLPQDQAVTSWCRPGLPHCQEAGHEPIPTAALARAAQSEVTARSGKVGSNASKRSASAEAVSPTAKIRRGAMQVWPPFSIRP